MDSSHTATSMASEPEVQIPKSSRDLSQLDRARREDPSRMKGLLEQMLLIRRFEEKAAALYKESKIGGFCHLYIGQEAVCVGAISTLGPDDYVLVSYREHGHALARGVDPGAIMAELCGKSTGVSKGKGGSMHLFDAPKGFLGGHAIVGGQIPLATGVAFASKYRRQPRVTLCFFGEAAVNIGAFHESLNLAALWRLPVVFICENNGFGMGTPVDRASSVSDLHRKAVAYDMARAEVDGMDVLAVREAVREAVERARTDNLPTLLEIRTYRYMGHSMSDPPHGAYRTREEVEEQKRHDPIKLFTSTLESLDLVSGKTLDEMEKRIHEIVDDAVAFAAGSPEPDPKEIYSDIYTP